MNMILCVILHKTNKHSNKMIHLVSLCVTIYIAIDPRIGQNKLPVNSDVLFSNHVKKEFV